MFILDSLMISGIRWALETALTAAGHFVIGQLRPGCIWEAVEVVERRRLQIPQTIYRYR